jgi:hypothetical protein
MKVVYVAGPYRDPRGEYWVGKNIELAGEYALEVWRRGAVAICPHKNSAFFGGALHPMGEEVWLEGDLELLKRSDAIFMVPGWEGSYGALEELEFAKRLGMTALFSIEQLDAWLKAPG